MHRGEPSYSIILHPLSAPTPTSNNPSNLYSSFHHCAETLLWNANQANCLFSHFIHLMNAQKTSTLISFFFSTSLFDCSGP